MTEYRHKARSFPFTVGELNQLILNPRPAGLFQWLCLLKTKQMHFLQELDLFHNKFTIWHWNSKNILTVSSTMKHYIITAHKHTNRYTVITGKKSTIHFTLLWTKLLKTWVFWYMTPCRLVHRYQCFEAYCFHLCGSPRSCRLDKTCDTTLHNITSQNNAIYQCHSQKLKSHRTQLLLQHLRNNT